MHKDYPEFPNLPATFPIQERIVFTRWGGMGVHLDVEILLSRKSCVPGIGDCSKGMHLIIQSPEDGAGDNTKPPREYKDDELMQLYRFAEQWANEHANRDEKGKPLWQIARRGTGMAKRTHVHIHLVLLQRKEDIPRFIDPVIALRDLAGMDADQISELIKQFQQSQSTQK